MTCEMTSRLDAYHDDELSAAERAAVEAHVRVCPACAEELRQLAAVTAALKLPTADMPPQALTRLHRRVEQLPGAGIRRLAGALAAVAAAILVAACTAVLSMNHPAVATPKAMPLWEAQATPGQSAEAVSASTEELVAAWTVQDLARRPEHD